MKILHIIAGAPQGGAETYFTDALRGLSRKGVEQFAITRPHKAFVDALDGANVGREHLPFSNLSKFWQKRKIAKIIEREQPDIVHAWMARAASFVPKDTKPPALGWFGGPYALKYYKNCDAYMGVTRGLRDYLQKETGRSENVFCVHTFGTLPKNDAQLSKKDFDIPDDAPVVLLLSRMHWKKGVDTLLNAAKKLPNVYFLLAGDGQQADEYKALSKKLGVDDRVRFLGWRTDRAALLDVSDVCTLPSRYEPFGTVMAEAWGASVPLVAAKADGARQYLEHGDNGLLCEIDDFEGLAKQLDAAINDTDLRQKIVNGGRKTYEELFSEDVAIESLIKAYEKILS